MCLNRLASRWPRIADFKSHIGSFVRVSEGLDGRRLRKAIISAAAASVDTARDLNKLQAHHVLDTLQTVAKVNREENIA